MDAIPCMQSYIGWLYTGYSKAEATPENNPTNSTLPQHKVSHRNKQIRGEPVKNIRKEIQMETMEKYYKRKLGKKYDDIQWGVYKKALNKKKAKGALFRGYRIFGT